MSPTNTPNFPANTLSRSTPYNVPDAALRGAALAFSAKPPVKPKPVIDAFLSGNGRSRSVSPNRLTGRQAKKQLLYERGSDTPELSVSPSMTAASLAAARHHPMVSESSSFITGPEHTSKSGSKSKWMEPTGKEDSHFASKEQLRTKGKPRTGEQLKTKGQLKTTLQGQDSATDSASIAPTISLVQLFEENSKKNTSPTGTKQATTKNIATTKGKPPLIVSPKPQRNIPIHSVSEEFEQPLGSLHVRRLPDVNHDRIVKVPAHATRSKSQDDIISSKPIIPPPRRATKKKQEKILEPSKQATQNHSEDPSPIFTDTSSTPSALANRPSLSIPGTPLNHSTSPSPKPYLTSNYKESSLKQISPHITGDHLANAIVGAHLAASRQPTPSLTSSTKQRPRPPSPRRKNKHNHHHHNINHRSPSPIKREPGKLRSTLRQNAESESEGGNSGRQKGFNRIVNKHPHKHSEGTRKRWRDTITESERKRYEGVWAANKGLYIHHPLSASSSLDSKMKRVSNGEEEVLNLVVRDIWLRSRLSMQVLEEVWFLVDRRGIGRLTKEEFVVGLWLIDQRLKGRKLPPKVGDSVWASVTGLGMKVRLKNEGGRKKR